MWLALAVIGQAASHQLIAAGPLVRYQHYLPVADWHSGTRLVAVMILAAQALFVGAAFMLKERQTAK